MNLTDELHRLADEPAPPMRLDLAAARARGMHLRRRNLVGAVVAVTAGVAALALVAGIAVPALRTVPATPTGSGTLVSHASFGWLPDTIVRVRVEDSTRFSFEDAVYAEGESEVTLRLKLTVLSVSTGHRPGKDPAVGDAPPRAEAAVPVNGRPAYWMTVDLADPLTGDKAFLRWQAADGRWVQLEATKLPTDAQIVLHRIASDVTVTDRAVPLPLRAHDLPPTSEVVKAIHSEVVSTKGWAWRAEIRYSTGFTLVLGTLYPGEPTTTAAFGQRAFKETGDNPEDIQVCVYIDFDSEAELVRFGGAQGILDRITLLGRDESDWATDIGG